MNNRFKHLGIYLPIFALITVATVVMRTVALIKNFDATSGYYNEKTLIAVSDYLLIAGIIFFFSYIFTADKSIRLIPSFKSPATYLPAGLITVASTFVAVHLIFTIFDVAKHIKELKLIGSDARLINNQRLLIALISITAIFAILTAVHFAATSLIENYQSEERARLGLAAVAFLALYAIYVYFKSGLPINSPNKVLDQMVYLLAAIFLLYDTRLTIGREKWRPYVAFGFIAASVAAYSSIPALIVYFINGTSVSASIYETVLSLLLFVFITARVLLTGYLTSDRPSPIAEALAAASRERELAINPIPEIPSVIDVEGEALDEPTQEDDNQITIDDVIECETEKEE